MHITDHARHTPEKIAVRMDSGASLSYRALDNGSIALARCFRELGLSKGDVVAIVLDNRPEYFVAVWAALRLGLYLTPINWHLKAEEVRHIVADSASSLMISASGFHEVAENACAGTACRKLLLIDRDEDWGTVAAAIASSAPVVADFEQAEGSIMYYSSGTTGRPKGIRRAIGERAFGQPSPLDGFLTANYGLAVDTVYLSPAPLYHAAPLNWCLAVLRFGGSVLAMEKFDATAVLRLIEAWQVSHAQFVPTMFVRMLKLGAEERGRCDLRSLRMVVHAAAPCPPQVKAQMIDWLGPVIYEYYGGSESNGVAAIDSLEWLARPGSVGRALLGQVHICDERGEELPAGHTGKVYFSGLPPFEYHNDAEKTARAYNHHGWSTLGDIGHLDAEGYLYLTDRDAFMIISGGVNIYPQEIENVLVSHPQVMDAAVIGLPHAEFGEEVVAFIELRNPQAAGAALARELAEFCRERLAGFKVPRRVEFEAALPRMPNGKLLKRLLKEKHLASLSG